MNRTYIPQTVRKMPEQPNTIEVLPKTKEMPVHHETAAFTEKTAAKRKKLSFKGKTAAAAALALAFLLFKVSFPETFDEMKDEAASLISGDIDYVAAMEHIGAAVSGEEDFSQSIQNAYISAFSQTEEKAETEVTAEITETAVQTAEEKETLPLEYWGASDLGEGDEAHRESVVSAFLESQGEYSEYALPAGVTYEMPDIAFDFICPVMGTVSSHFGYREHPNDGAVRFHYGTDIAADEGTEILSFADGEVLAVGESTGYGLYVLIEHSDGVKTQYSHCSEIFVESGDAVTKGDCIAAVGQTGNATGPCLHFEIIHEGDYVNPEFYVSWS